MRSGLAGETCAACHKDSPRVTAAEIAELSPQIPDWTFAEVDGTSRLERTFRFATYSDALAFTQRVGELADAQGHHPVIVTEWRKVRVVWWTHAIEGLHRNDFIMAAKTDELFASRNALNEESPTT